MTDGFKVVEGKFPEDLEFFVAVAMQGVFYVSKNEKKLVSAKERSYGITYDRDKKCWLYAGAFDGEFVYFDKDGEKEKITVATKKTLAKKQLFYNIHQIDFIEDYLYVMVGGNATVKVLDTKDNFKTVDEIKPMKTDYVHMNSVFMHNDIIYMVAHNKTFYSGVPSQLVELDRNHKVINIRDNQGHTNHNFYTNGEEDLWCNSYGNRIMRNGKTFFKAEKNDLLRGLSISDKYIVVGGSTLSPKTVQRIGKSNIYITDRKGNLLCKLVVTLPSFILEIRQINPTCLTITNNNL